MQHADKPAITSKSDGRDASDQILREQKPTQRPRFSTFRELVQVFVGLMIGTVLIIACAWTISPIFGGVVAFFLAFVLTISVLPVLAAQMVAALALALRERTRK